MNLVYGLSYLWLRSTKCHSDWKNGERETEPEWYNLLHHM